MCQSAEHLTPRARVLVGQIFDQLRTNVAAMYDCDPADVQIGPVDFGGAPPDDEAPRDPNRAERRSAR